MQNLKLHGSKNIRDLGGKPSSFRSPEGTPLHVRSGVLLRGGHLRRISQKDTAILQDQYRLSLIVDLRTPDEIQQKPDRLIPGAKHVHLPIYDNATFGITHENWKTDTWEQLTARIPNMADLYRKAIRGDCLRNLAAVIRTIITHDPEDGAVLYHCTEGKDRTGITSYILLTMLGVGEQDIFDDYLFTNLVARRRARRYANLIRILKFDFKTARRFTRIMLADPAFLEAVIITIREDWKDFDTFVSEGLGITQEELDTFRSRYLV